MALLIAAAVDSELAWLIAELHSRPAGRVGNFPYSIGYVGNLQIYLAATGVGIASAALAFGALIPALGVDRAVMIGSAGALPGSDLDVGDVVAASSETLAEFGICESEGIGDAGSLDLPGLEQSIFLDEDLSRHLIAAAEGSYRCLTVPCLTVAGASANPIQARTRAERFGAMAENMEGYALALAGTQFGIKVGELRAISNQAGVRDKSAWNLELANERVQAVTLNAVSLLRGNPGRTFL